MLRRVARAAFLVVALAAPAQLVVGAHAELLRSAPEANSILAFGPASADLYFSESVEIEFARVAVLSAAGDRVDVGEPRLDPADPSHMSVALRSLAPGVYTVSWQVLSAVDGHITSGAFSFAVGSASPAEIPPPAGAVGQPAAHADQVPRWLIYLSLVALAGGPLFRILVWEPSRAAARAEGLEVADLSLAWREVQGISLFVFFAAGAATFLLQAGAAAGIPVALPWSAAASDFLISTRQGSLWCGRWLVGFLLAGLYLRGELEPKRWPALALPYLLLLSLPLGGHAAADSRPLVPVLVDWIHLSAAAVWLGGLGHFLLGLQQLPVRSEKDSVRFVAALIPRFSAVALPSVGLIVATGLAQALARVGSIEALRSTGYGLTLAFKTGIFLPMLALGAVNLLWVRPRMTRAARAGTDAITVAAFARNVLYESALGAGLLLAVTMLVATPPAVTIRSGPEIRMQASAEDLEIGLAIAPGRAGVNRFEVGLRSLGGQVGEVLQATLELRAEGSLEPPILVELQEENGLYTGSTPGLAKAGAWNVRLSVRRVQEFDAIHVFDVEIGPAPVAVTDWSKVSRILLLFGGPACAWAIWPRRPLTAGGGVRLAPAAAMAVLALVLLASPPRATADDPVNAVPATTASVARGAELYAEHCNLCHGPQGKGDGPIGVTLNPPPADLTLHTVPGVHTDGRLFLWIRDGFPNSPMPAFGETISEEDMWHLVNFIRTLPTAEP